MTHTLIRAVRRVRKLPLPALAAAALFVAVLASGACIPADNAPGSGPSAGTPSPTPPATPPPAPSTGAAPPVYTPPPAPTPPAPGVGTPPPAPPVAPPPVVNPPPPPPGGGYTPPPPPPPGRGDPPEPPPIDTITYLIVGNDQVLGAGDQELSDLLDDLEFDTTVLDDAENAREAFDANLIIISESVNANTINGEYRNERVPMLICLLYTSPSPRDS